MTVRERLQEFRARDEGSSLVETALSLTLFLSLLLSAIGASQASYAHHFVTFAAKQGARYAMVRGSTFAGTTCGSTDAYSCQATVTDIQNYILGHVPMGISTKAITVQATWPGLAASGLNCLTLNGTKSPGCDVQVTVNYSFGYHLPFLPSQLLQFSSTAVLPIAQ